MNPFIIAVQLLIADADVEQDTYWGRDFQGVEYNGDSWVAYRMGQPGVPIPISKEFGEWLRNDRALGVAEAYGGYSYGFQFWTRLGEIILYKPDPYADVRDGLMDEMEQFENGENQDDRPGN